MFDRSATLRASAGVAGAGFALALALIAGLAAFGLDWVGALRDRALTDGPAAGLISDLGIWLAVLAAAPALWQGIARHDRAAFWLGAFCAVFALDDVAMLHERAPFPEVFAFAAIFGLFVVPWRLFAKEVGTWWVAPMVVVLICFAVSVVFDVVYARLVPIMGWSQDLGTLIEDGAKFAGLFALCVFAYADAFARTPSTDAAPGQGRR